MSGKRYRRQRECVALGRVTVEREIVVVQAQYALLVSFLDCCISLVQKRALPYQLRMVFEIRPFLVESRGIICVFHCQLDTGHENRVAHVDVTFSGARD